MHLLKVIILALLVVLIFRDSNAQNTNPVERQVANPITDTPNINPISTEQDIKAPKQKKTSLEAAKIKETSGLSFNFQRTLQIENSFPFFVVWKR